MILSVLSSPALVSGLMVARAKNPVHSVLFPIPVFRDTSGLLLLLGLDFFAMIFPVVHIEAIAVSFLFVVMMFHIQIAEIHEEVLRYLPVSGIIGLILWWKIKLRVMSKLPVSIQVVLYLVMNHLTSVFLGYVAIFLIACLMAGGGSLFDIVAPFLEGGHYSTTSVQPPAPSDPTPAFLPVGPEEDQGQAEQSELPEPLLSEEARRMELERRLNSDVENGWASKYDAQLLDAQIALELKLESALRAEGYSDQSVFEFRDGWRKVAFSPDSRPGIVTTKALQNTLSKYSLDIRNSLNFRRIIKAVSRGEIHLKKND